MYALLFGSCLILLYSGLGFGDVAWGRNVHDLEQWNTVSLEVKVKPKIRLQMEVQPRLNNNITTMDRLLIRGAVGYQVNKNLSVWQGYCWTPSFEPAAQAGETFVDTVVHENRVYQQVLFENEYKRLKIMNRTRLEERQIENVEGLSVRARHLLRLTHPIRQSEKWALVGSNELFFNVNDTRNGAPAGFEQNRFYVGVKRQLNPNISVDVGYINIQVNQFGSSINRTNHGLSLGLNFKY